MPRKPEASPAATPVQWRIWHGSALPHQGDPIYEAGVQLGRLLRTAFLADFCLNDVFRSELHRVLNWDESVNTFKRAVYTGRISLAQAKRVDEMQAVAKVLGMLISILMQWDTTLNLRQRSDILFLVAASSRGGRLW